MTFEEEKRNACRITGPEEKYLEATPLIEVLAEARHGGGSLDARGTPDPLFSAVKAMLR